MFQGIDLFFNGKKINRNFKNSELFIVFHEGPNSSCWKLTLFSFQKEKISWESALQIPFWVVQVVLLLLGHSRANVKALMIFLASFLTILEIVVGRFPVLPAILWQRVCFVPSPSSCSTFEVIWLWKWAGSSCAGTVTEQLHTEIQSCSCRSSPAEQFLGI